MRLRKPLFLTGSVLLLILLLAPALVGLQLADSSTEARLQTLTGQPGLRLQLDNGWFGSTGEITVEAPVIGGVDYPMARLRATLDVQHGPLLWTPGGFGLGFVAATVHPDLASGLPRSVITVVAGLDGSLHGLLENGEWALPGTQTLATLADLRIALDILPTGQMTLNASSSRLQIVDPFMTLEVLAPAVRLQSENLAHSPLPGTLTLSADTLSMVAQNDSAQDLRLEGLLLHYAASATPGSDGRGPTLSLLQRLTLDNVLGSLPVADLQVDAELEGIDQDAVVAYLTMLRDTQPLLNVMPPAELQAYVASQSQDFTLALAQFPLTQRLQVALQYNGHPVQGSLELNWPGEPTALVMRRVSLGRALRIVHITLDLTVNEAAFAGGPLAPAVATYVTQGLLSRDQNNVVLNATLYDGSLSLNTQRFPLEPFLRFLTPGQP